MPQIWMTYDELGALCGCGAMEARDRAIRLSLDRRRSRDGATRVKLDQILTVKFFASIREANFDLDYAIEALDETHRQMAELLDPSELHNRRGVA
ncbi:hypothetical protein ABIG06_004184 [Bradyrhizobium sp. USDA 326]|uniref:hypothetical protein n=1 Tax=unclassified Bradyrhizobium TaxID=2631580 RepID=UPI000F53D7B9|nr:hypothetical protein [Bradyrhizobium sp. RP6]RQH11505.1 hypothetical protein EHH60_19925 [Bradyrhizobium sp. RP6]